MTSRGWAVVALLLAPLALASWRLFPLSDDAWAALLLEERGAGLIPNTLHRTVLAQIWDWFFANFKMARGAGVAVLLVFWGAYAATTAALWRRLYPGLAADAWIAGVLVLAPAVATTHLLTLVVILPVGVPALVGLWGVLVLWGGRVKLSSAMTWWAALIVSFVLSEFSVAATFLVLVALGWWWWQARESSLRRRVLTLAGGSMAATFLGMLLFRFAFSRPELRPDAGLDSNVASLLADPLETALLLPTRIWWAIAGAYAQEMGTWRLVWGEKSTLAAAAFGLLVAGALCWVCRSQDDNPETEASETRSGFLLAFLLAASLLPEMVRQALLPMGSSWRPEELATRFMVQSQPFAACATLALLRWVVTPRRWVVVVLLVGFFCGHTVFFHAYRRLRQEDTQRRLGQALRPYVEKTSGLVVAILPEYLGREYEIVYKATRDWPAGLSQRLWVMWDGRTARYFGQPLQRSGECQLPATADIDVSGVLRQGPVGLVVWVEAIDKGRQFRLQPYCVETARFPSSGTSSPARGASLPVLER